MTDDDKEYAMDWLREQVAVIDGQIEKVGGDNPAKTLLAMIEAQAPASGEITDELTAAEPKLLLTPLHIKLLQRGQHYKYIGLSDDMGMHMAEVSALGDLRRAGFVEHAKGPFPPGPPSPTPSVITDAGRKALAEVDPGRPVPHHGSGP